MVTREWVGGLTREPGGMQRGLAKLKKRVARVLSDLLCDADRATTP
jgi:hypothetical protein